MDSRWLKIIAILLMTVDHAGMILFPDIEVLRIIGRLSYPLFAFLIAYGCTKTRNISRYFLRLIAFAVWLQILWVAAGLVIDSFITPGFNNIFFTLALGVLAIWVIKEIQARTVLKNKMDNVVMMVFIAILAILICLAGEVLGMDYGVAGVLLIVLFYAIIQSKKLLPAGRAWSLAYRFIAPMVALAFFNGIFMLFYDWTTQWWSMLSVVFLWAFIDKKIKSHWLEKYAFYIYYPLHFCILYLISYFL